MCCYFGSFGNILNLNALLCGPPIGNRNKRCMPVRSSVRVHPFQPILVSRKRNVLKSSKLSEKVHEILDHQAPGSKVKVTGGEKAEGCNTYRQSRDQAIKCKARHNSSAEYRVNIQILLGLGRENYLIPNKTDLTLLSASGLESRLL